MTNRKFTLEYIDQATACIIAESVFEVDDVTALCEILDVSEADLRPSISYSLDMEDIEKIKFRFNITKESPSTGAYLSSWSDLTQLPYTIHTRRELIMMLRGEKPFAAFMDSFPSFAEFEIIPESRFDPYVESGLFIKKEYLVDERTERQARRVLYAARGEEWRIEAAMQLWKTAGQRGGVKSLNDAKECSTAMKTGKQMRGSPSSWLVHIPAPFRGLKSCAQS